MTDLHDSHSDSGGSSRLLPLTESGLSIESVDEDIRGFTVRDAGGEDLGTVDDLIVDEGEGKIRFLRIAHGGILGIGSDKFLLPVETVARLDNGEVHVNQDRDRITGGPRYDPELTESRAYEDLYGYYGVGPYWAPGYVYPPYPYYP